MSFCSRVVAIVALLALTQARAQSTRPDTPQRGPWKGRPIGTFLVARISTTPSTTQPVVHTFRRTLLVGSDDGLARFSIAESAAATGPWMEKYGSGDAVAPDAEVRTTPLGDQSLMIDDGRIACHGARTETTTDRSIEIKETWTTDDGRDLKQIVSSRPRDGDARAVVFYEAEAVGHETLDVDGGQVVGILIRGRSRTGRGQAVVEEVLSADVPGQRLAFRRWADEDRTKPPVMTELAISTGLDVTAAAASHFKPTQRKTAAQERESFLAATLAQATADDATQRANGLRTLAMNRWTDADRAAMEPAIRRGLVDADAGVRRAAALAAGWNRLPNASRDILAAMSHEPGDRREFIHALGYAAEPEGLAAVIAAVQGNRTAMSQVDDLVAFDLPAADAVLDQIAASTDKRMKASLMRALARGKSRHGIALLIAATRDPDRMIRVPALQSLVARADPSALDTAIAALRDMDDLARRSAIHAVVSCGQAEKAKASDALATLLSDPAAKPVRSAVAMALVALGNDRAVPTLREMLARPADFVDRYALLPADQLAVLMFCRLGTPAAVDELLKLGQGPTKSDMVLNQMRQAKSPFVSRVAWTWWQRAIVEGGPATRPATPSGSQSDYLLQIVSADADTALRDAVRTAIDSADVRQRPALRQAVRQMDKRLAEGPPAAGESVLQPPRAGLR